MSIKYKNKPFVDYFEYITSTAWQDIKARYMASDHPKSCGVCGRSWVSDGTFDFHHKTYKRLGAEWLIDIAPVCHDPCHQLIHDIHKEQQSSSANKGLWWCLSEAKRRIAALRGGVTVLSSS
jgi:hypothetical protein